MKLDCKRQRPASVLVPELVPEVYEIRLTGNAPISRTVLRVKPDSGRTSTTRRKDKTGSMLPRTSSGCPSGRQGVNVSPPQEIQQHTSNPDELMPTSSCPFYTNVSPLRWIQQHTSNPDELMPTSICPFHWHKRASPLAYCFSTDSTQ